MARPPPHRLAAMACPRLSAPSRNIQPRHDHGVGPLAAMTDGNLDPASFHAFDSILEMHEAYDLRNEAGDFGFTPWDQPSPFDPTLRRQPTVARGARPSTQ